MSFILDDINTYLTGLSLAGGTYPIYEGYIPDDQDNMMAVFETGGMPPVEIDRPNEIVTFQFRVRTSRLNYAVGRQQWLTCFNALQDSVLGMPAVYIFVQCMHYGPLFFNDDKGRSNFISNFRVKRITETNSD